MSASTCPSTFTPLRFHGATSSSARSRSTDTSSWSAASAARCASSASITTGMPFCGRRATLAVEARPGSSARCCHAAAPLAPGCGRREIDRARAGSRPSRLRRQRRDRRRRHKPPARPPRGQSLGVRTDVARQRRGQRLAVAALERVAIGRGAAIEHARQLLHALGHAEVADAEFAQRMIDVLRRSRRSVSWASSRAAPASPRMPVLEQEHVQRQHLEAAERRIGHLPVRIKSSAAAPPPRLRA